MLSISDSEWCGLILTQKYRRAPKHARTFHPALLDLAAVRLIVIRTVLNFLDVQYRECF